MTYSRISLLHSELEQKERLSFQTTKSAQLPYYHTSIGINIAVDQKIWVILAVHVTLTAMSLFLSKHTLSKIYWHSFRRHTFQCVFDNVSMQGRDELTLPSLVDTKPVNAGYSFKQFFSPINKKSVENVYSQDPLLQCYSILRNYYISFQNA